MRGEARTLDRELANEVPLVLNFVFTTCSTSCSLQTAVLAQVQRELAARAAARCSWPASPSTPTTTRRSSCAASPAASAPAPGWQFYTGRFDDLLRVQKHFDVYRGSKASHPPVLLMRRHARAPWLRVEGFPAARPNWWRCSSRCPRRRDRARWLAALLRRRCAAAAAQAADAERGRPSTRARRAVRGGMPRRCRPPASACHRPSGMGNFEGGLAVPPIAGPTLFQPLDRDTGRFFAASSRWRVRPAYDEASLGRLLRSGVSPDGVTLPATMPRYALADADLADLGGLPAHALRRAAAGARRATRCASPPITTPDADPARRDAMLATLQHFVAQKNGQSRHEAQRSVQSSRTREMVMYRKFRVWQLEHWALQGEPSTWAAQLDARQSRAAGLRGGGRLGGAQWAPVDEFCARHRLPCLLPLVEAGGGRGAGLLQPALPRRHRCRCGAGRARAAEGAGPAPRGAVERGAGAGRARARRARARRPACGRCGTRRRSSRCCRRRRTRRACARPRRAICRWPGCPARTRSAGPAGRDAAADGARLDRHADAHRRAARPPARSAPDCGCAGRVSVRCPPTSRRARCRPPPCSARASSHLDFGFTPEYLLELLEHGLENVMPVEPLSAPGHRARAAHRLQGQLGGRGARRPRRLAVGLDTLKPQRR